MSETQKRVIIQRAWEKYQDQFDWNKSNVFYVPIHENLPMFLSTPNFDYTPIKRITFRRYAWKFTDNYVSVVIGEYDGYGLVM